MKSIKDLLRQRFVELQRRVATMEQTRRAQEEACRQREEELYLALFEILDAFDALDAIIDEKQAQMDKTAQRLARSVRSLKRQLGRVLEERDVREIELAGNKARMEDCKIIDTRVVPGAEDMTVVEVIRKGYRLGDSRRVLRKAEVITVRGGTAVT